MDIRQIIKRAGGDETVAQRIGKTAGAVKKWPLNGIPDRHWPDLIALCNGAISPTDLYQANLTARQSERAREAV